MSLFQRYLIERLHYIIIKLILCIRIQVTRLLHTQLRSLTVAMCRWTNKLSFSVQTTLLLAVFHAFILAESGKSYMLSGDIHAVMSNLQQGMNLDQWRMSWGMLVLVMC